MNNAQTLIVCLLVTSLVTALPNAYAAQSTSINGLTHPSQAVAGNTEPIYVSATVSYSEALPGYTLAVGVLDAEMAPESIVPGIATSSPDPCLNQFVLTAVCLINISAASGAEQVAFRIGGILGGKHQPGAWKLNMTAALLDSNGTLIPNSTNSVLFEIELTPVTLKVTVPADVAVSIDGSQQPPGPAAVAVALGEHNITVPLLVQVNPTTRLRFDHWSDGSTNANRTVFLTGDANIDVTYVTQNLLTISGPQADSTGGGWYDEDTTATFSVAQIEPMGGLLGFLGGKLVFQSWSENGELLTHSTTGTISMNQPHTITAVWQGDYSEPMVIIGGILVILAFAYLLARGGETKPKRRSRSRRQHG